MYRLDEINKSIADKSRYSFILILTQNKGFSSYLNILINRSSYIELSSYLTDLFRILFQQILVIFIKFLNINLQLLPQLTIYSILDSFHLTN